MFEEIAARYAQYSTAELFELARAGESKLRPEAWQSLKNELRNRGLELTPDDEALAAGRPGESITTEFEPPESEPVSDSVPGDVGGWLAVFLVLMAMSVVLRTSQSLEAFRGQSRLAVLYGLHAVTLMTGIVLVYYRDPVAPAYWRAVMLLTAGLSVFLAAANAIAFSVALPTGAMAVAWAAYWNKSRRVQATFGTYRYARVAPRLDMSTASPDEELDESSELAASDAEPVPSVEGLYAELNDARRQGNAAVVFVALGLALTIGTWAASGGRRYYIAWGAILFGLIGAGRSNARRNRAKALLENASSISQIGE